MSVAGPTVIVVPCFNEANRLNTQAFLAFAAGHPAVFFLFVNDGSRDRTQDVLEVLRHANPKQMHLLALERNSGKAEAVRRGFLAAMNMECGKIGYWDADLSTPLGAIESFEGLFNQETQVSIVMGSRVKLLGRNINRRVVRHYLGRIFATWASLILGLPVYDTQCGAKIFRNDGELRAVFAEPFLSRWAFDVEILARYIKVRQASGGLPVEASTIEYPLEEWTDVSGSKIRFKDYFVLGLDLVRLFIYRRKPARPGGRFR